jgi:hypothetical protein
MYTYLNIYTHIYTYIIYIYYYSKIRFQEAGLRQSVGFSEEELYTAVQDMCIHKLAAELPGPSVIWWSLLPKHTSRKSPCNILLPKVSPSVP